MAAQLTFRPAAEYQPGAVYTILARCYADILDVTLHSSLRQFDREIFASPDTVGACAFISSTDDTVIGFFSYDPRQGPEIGVIGHNGVLPSFQRQGFGTQQILEILRLFTAHGFAQVRVTTSEQPFFLPARRMYDKCGFHVSGTAPATDASPYGIVQYEKSLIV
jgi:GNAT superfamily N-acetyltransferase